MKKHLSILAMVFLMLFSIEGNTQEKFTSYDNTYSGKTYEIKISTSEKEKFSLYIDALSLDRTHEKGGLIIDQKYYDEFISAISEAKLKYAEWVKTAKDNNVKELSKTMTIKSRSGSYFMFGSKWNFQFLVNLKFDFRVIDSNGEMKYLLLIKTGELKSSSNQFMKVDGLALIFSSESEIDEFTSAISKDKITEFSSKPKKEELFKD